MRIITLIGLERDLACGMMKCFQEVLARMSSEGLRLSGRERHVTVVGDRTSMECCVQKYGAQADIVRMQTEDGWSTQDAAASEQYRLTITRRCPCLTCQYAVK